MHRHDLAPILRGVRGQLRLGVTAVTLAVALWGCREPQSTTDPDSADPAAAAESTPKPLPVTHWEGYGVGHTANIDRVVLSGDGTAALTRDQIGGARLWPALDGTLEPVALPMQGPQQFSVQRFGKGFTVAAVDAANGAKIFDVDPKGTITELAALPPFKPLFAIHVLPGGEHCVALFRDHTIRLFDRKGAELHRFEAKMFQASSLRIAADGKTIMALIGPSGSPSKTTLQPLELSMGADGKTPSIRRAGDSRTVESTTAVSDSSAALSPDGQRFAIADKPVGNEWELMIVDLSAKEKLTRIQVPVPSHLVPTLGFVGANKLLVSANDGSLSWMVDVTDGSRHPRTSAPQDFISQGRAQAVVAGVQAVGYGTWLFVHDVERRSHRYLGYRNFQTQSVAVAPSSKWVAWAYMSGPVFVESLGGGEGERVELRSPDGTSPSKVRFFDDDHVIIVDMAGGIRLVHWRDGVTVAEAGIHGAIRNLQFDDARGLMLVERHSNDVHLFEVTAEGFEGPYIVADQSFRAGLLKGDKEHKEAVLWTLDGTNAMRHYTLEELRADLEHSAVNDKAVPLPTGKVAPVAIDSKGRSYGVRWNGTTMELFVDYGERVDTVAAPAGDIGLIVPSPGGKMFVAVHQRGQNASISGHMTESLEERWSYSPGVFSNEIVWSPDGRYVAVAGNTGAAVLDARTGEVVQQRCGINFEQVGAAPPTAFNAINVRSMCEG